MSNRTKYKSKLLREQPAAPAPRTVAIGTVNDYWVTRRKQREAQARKRASLTNSFK
tara:strand:+ start:2684 stop:2851 length:168 start_codon:yes stop_codon:yes gene_type:complete